MATTADFKNGLYLNFNGKPCSIVWFQHVKPGKGPAFVKTKLRNLENGRILENTFTAGAKIETINVEHRGYQFLYADEEGFNFMNEDNYEQISLPKDLVENADLVTLQATYADPAVKGNTASTSALKEVELETGAKIMVPLFINTDDVITVNTTDRSYGQRVNG